MPISRQQFFLLLPVAINPKGSLRLSMLEIKYEIVNSVTDKINQRAIMISFPFHVLFHEGILKARSTT